jgi:hypothetical protein
MIFHLDCFIGALQMFIGCIFCVPMIPRIAESLTVFVSASPALQVCGESLNFFEHPLLRVQGCTAAVRVTVL